MSSRGKKGSSTENTQSANSTSSKTSTGKGGAGAVPAAPASKITKKTTAAPVEVIEAAVEVAAPAVDKASKGKATAAAKSAGTSRGPGRKPKTATTASASVTTPVDEGEPIAWTLQHDLQLAQVLARVSGSWDDVAAAISEQPLLAGVSNKILKSRVPPLNAYRNSNAVMKQVTEWFKLSGNADFDLAGTTANLAQLDEISNLIEAVVQNGWLERAPQSIEWVHHPVTAKTAATTRELALVLQEGLVGYNAHPDPSKPDITPVMEALELNLTLANLALLQSLSGRKTTPPASDIPRMLENYAPQFEELELSASRIFQRLPSDHSGAASASSSAAPVSGAKPASGDTKWHIFDPKTPKRPGNYIKSGSADAEADGSE